MVLRGPAAREKPGDQNMMTLIAVFGGILGFAVLAYLIVHNK